MDGGVECGEVGFAVFWFFSKLCGLQELGCQKKSIVDKSGIPCQSVLNLFQRQRNRLLIHVLKQYFFYKQP